MVEDTWIIAGTYGNISGGMRLVIESEKEVNVL